MMSDDGDGKIAAGDGNSQDQSTSNGAGQSTALNSVWPIKDSEGNIVVPFTYGSVAFWQGKKAAEYQNFRWHVFIRGANNEDLSPLIDRVIFQLHPSFNNPTRVVDQPPFHVSELGWGEFEVIMRIHLHEGPEQGIELRHMLQLFPKVGELNMRRPVVSERMDELVFNRPSDTVLRQIVLCNKRLPAAPVLTAQAWGNVEKILVPFNLQDELLKMDVARRRVQAETQLLKDEYEELEQEHALMVEEVRRLEPPHVPKDLRH